MVQLSIFTSLRLKQDEGKKADGGADKEVMTTDGTVWRKKAQKNETWFKLFDSINSFEFDQTCGEE